MDGFVDIHTHILPNIDDGSTSMEETFEMLELAYQEGIRTVYMTPHCGRCNPNFDVEESKAVMELVEGTLKKMHPDMSLIFGNEVLYYSDMVTDIKEGTISTLGKSNCVLIEFATNIDFSSMQAAVRELKAARYVPIIAHVERYNCLQNDIEKLDVLHGEGAYFQVNADMLLEPPVEETSNGVIGIFKFPPIMSTIQLYKNYAWMFVRSGKIDFIASDAHGSEYRKPVMKTALQMVYKYAAPETALKLIDKANLLNR